MIVTNEESPLFFVTKYVEYIVKQDNTSDEKRAKTINLEPQIIWEDKSPAPGVCHKQHTVQQSPLGYLSSNHINSPSVDMAL